MNLRLCVVTLLLIAASAGVFASDTYPPALFDAIGRERDVRECAAQYHKSPRDYAQTMDLARTVLSSGTIVYRAGGRDSCIDGNDNSRLYAFVKSSDGTFRKVLDGGGVCTFNADGTLVSDWHDSASVLSRTVYHYDGTSYRDVRHEIVWYASGEAKLAAVPVRFATGTSSGTVSGKVYYGFPDTYILDAAGGQTMSIAIQPVSGTLGNVSVGQGANRYESHGALLTDSTKLSWSGKLAESGRYFISVDGSQKSDSAPKPATYTMTISIR